MYQLDSSISCSTLPLVEVQEPSWSREAASAYEKTVSTVRNVVQGVVEHPVESVAVAGAVLAGLYCSRFQIGRLLGLARANPQIAGSLVESTGTALERKALGEGLLKLENLGYRSLLPKPGTMASSEIALHSFPNIEISGRGVAQAAYGISSAEVPLATRGLFTCSALVVQNEKAGMHYLAHLDTTESAAQILHSLKSFDLSKSRIFLLKGSYGDIATERHLLEALSQRPGALQNLRIGAAACDGASTYGIVSYKNQLYRYDRKMMTSWPMLETGKYQKNVLIGLGASNLPCSPLGGF